MESDQNECSVSGSGLTSFTIGHFEARQSTVQAKASFDGVTSVSCFNEASVSRDAISRNAQFRSVDVVPFDGTNNLVTTASQDNLLQNTQVTVLNVPESSIFEVVQTVSQDQPSIGELIVDDMHINVCPGNSNNHNELQEQQQSNKTIKRKGGWPKGKKRKKEIQDVNKPKAPVTGYVRFLNSRREELKQLHPDLSFPKITKMLGVEWNTILSHEEKKKFLDEAENDKKRYIEELAAYQQSEKYQAFVKRQQAKRVKPAEGETDEIDNESSILASPVDEDSNGLFCKTCNQHFSSLHNKNEHMYGRQHLQMLTCEFERESTAKLSTSSTGIPASSPTTCQTTFSIPQFAETFLEQNLNRELEIRELRKSIHRSQEQNIILSKQYEELKGSLEKAEEMMSSHKSIGASLSAQLNTLRMVPNLFGVQVLNVQTT